MCQAPHAQAIDRAVFPGLQGGPHNHTTAAIAVALDEAAQREFPSYAHQIVANAKALAAALVDARLRARLGRNRQPPDPDRPDQQRLPGKVAAKTLDRAGLRSTTTPSRSTPASRSILGHPAGTPR